MSEMIGATSTGIIVVGGGMSGITAAVEAAEAGQDVILLEKEPFLGGRVARLNEYFPKRCPPTCGMEINFRRMRQNPRIKVITMAEVKSISGQMGAFEVTVDIAPRRVNDNCTACDKCVEACPVERPDAFNVNLGTTRAIYLPFGMAYPQKYVIDDATCLGQSCSKCVAYCPYDAIELAEKSKTVTFAAGAVIVTTGWQPYDAKRLTNLGFGLFPDVVTNVMLERLAAKNGPTQGTIRRLSDEAPLKRVAFVQCAGSRDENHLPYCSAVCCTATFKQAAYVRQQYPDAEIHIFYIDIRTMGVLEDFYLKVVKDDAKIFLHKGKVAKVEQVADNRLAVIAEDILSGERRRQVVDLVVLATGMAPEPKLEGAPCYDEYGFAVSGETKGIFSAGCAKHPADVVTSARDATASALHAIQSVRR